MKNLVLFVLSLILSQTSFASCLNQESETPKQRCSYLEIFVKYLYEDMEVGYQAIVQSKTIPISQKTFFTEGQVKFHERLKEDCKDNLECTRVKLIQRMGEMKKFYCDYHECPEVKNNR